MSDIIEIWKDIPGYIGIYQASNLGRIRSCPGKTTSNKKFSKREWKVRVLKAKKDNQRGDLRVTLWKDGGHKDFLVARLVALTWCSGYSNNMTVNHIDGNFTNNYADNLEWVSLSENIKHGFRSGLFSSIQKRIRLIDSNGAYKDFPSLAEASRYLGKDVRYVSNAIKKSHVIKDNYGEVYTYKFL